MKGLERLFEFGAFILLAETSIKIVPVSGESIIKIEWNIMWDQRVFGY